MRRTARRATTTAAAAAVLVALPTIGWAVDPLTDPLFHFVGTVSDPLGRPVASGAVADGLGKSVSTLADGSYRLGERDFNRSYRLTASKAGMDPVAKDVYVAAPVDTTVDFTLLYRTTAALRSTTLSAASGAASTVLDVTTYAPQPGLPGDAGGKSCVSVHDSGTGQRTAATFSGYAADGAARWTWDVQVAAGTPERTSALTVRTEDCASATALARTASASYVVDNSAPAIGDLQPADGSNTATATAQLLSATVRDIGGAGVAASGISFTVTDTTTLDTRTVAAASYNATTGRATAGPVALALGHRHRVGVTVTDRAGNQTAFEQRAADEGGGVLAVTVAPRSTAVEIPRVPCTVVSQDLLAGKTSVVCRDIDLGIADTLVDVSGAADEGTGFVELNAPVNQAVIEYTDGLQRKTYAPYTTAKYVPLRFEVTAATETGVTVTASGRTIRLGDVTATLPSGIASDASLVLTARAVSGTVAACATPTAIAGAAARCISDPLETRVVVMAKAGVSASALGVKHADKFGVTVDATEGDHYFARVPNGLVDDLRADAEVREVARDVQYDYAVPAARVRQFDVSGTPAGAAAIAAATDLTGPLTAFDMSAASGTADGTEPDIMVVPMAQSSVISTVYSYIGSAGSRYVDFGIAAGANANVAATGNRGTGSWRNVGEECFGYFQDDYSKIQTCYRLSWLDRDPEAGYDGFSLLLDGRGGGKSNFRRTTTLRVRMEPLTPGMQWDGIDRWAPAYDQDAGSGCFTLDAGGGFKVKVFEVSLGFSKTFCERWDISVNGTPGWFQNEWRGRAPYLGNGDDRQVSAMAGVKAPPGTVKWRVVQGWNHY